MKPNALLLLTSLILTLIVQIGIGIPLSDEDDNSQRLGELILNKLAWRNIGPAVMGGRIDDFAVVESDPNTIYTATASGGLFLALYMAPRMTAWRGSSLKKPTTTSSPGSGQKK